MDGASATYSRIDSPQLEFKHVPGPYYFLDKSPDIPFAVINKHLREFGNIPFISQKKLGITVYVLFSCQKEGFGEDVGIPFSGTTIDFTRGCSNLTQRNIKVDFTVNI